MELFILIATTLFWIIFYIFQGIHDTHLIKEVELLQSKLNETVKFDIRNSIIRREVKWKFWGSIEKLFTKLFLSLLICIITKNLTFSILLLILSVFIRWLIHDLTVAIGLKRGLNHIGPDFVWTDRYLRKLAGIGINQYFIKIVPIIILLFYLLNYIDN